MHLRRYQKSLNRVWFKGNLSYNLEEKESDFPSWSEGANYNGDPPNSISSQRVPQAHIVQQDSLIADKLLSALALAESPGSQVCHGS